MDTYFCEVCHQPITGADIEDRHSTPDGEDCHRACCTDPAHGPPECRYTYTTGRGWEGGQGRVIHAVPVRSDGNVWPWTPALCGYKPGPRSNGWSEWRGGAATCPRCVARMGK
jgi:hypothetical protein